MGCSNMCQSDVEFEQIDMKISKKNCQTLEKFGKGATAKRQREKLKKECISAVTGKLK
jgi:hypothetical protein